MHTAMAYIRNGSSVSGSQSSVDIAAPHPIGSAPIRTALSQKSDEPCGRMEAPAWHVLATDFQAEDLAAASLLALGFQRFLPRVRVSVPATESRPARIEIQVAFPGYLFALWAPSDRWDRVKAAKGVAHILAPVGDPDVPATVPTAFVEAMLAVASPTGVLSDEWAPDVRYLRPDVLPEIAANSFVRVLKGPLSGRIALCEQSRENRVALLYEIMGGQRRIIARRDHVEPA